MTPNDENIDKALGLFGKPSPEQVESAGEQVLRRLQSSAELTVRQNQPHMVAARSNWRVRFVLAVAAGVIVMLGVWFVRGDHPAVLEAAGGSTAVNYLDTITSLEPGQVIRLSDGSFIEMRVHSQLSLERVSDGVRIRLDKGGIIVKAAKQHSGHLYVLTKDVLVSVVGTVFFVNAEEEGSRVAVIEGEVHVQQGATEKKLTPGEQVASNPKMEPITVKEELTWSRQAVEHVAMLEQAQSSLSRSAASAARLKFAAASVRPVRDEEMRERMGNGEGWIEGPIKCLGSDGLLGAAPGAQDPSARRGRCTAKAADLRTVVHDAYASARVSPPWWRLVGFPTDNSLHYFQIEGVADDPEHVTKGELKLMLQTLLEDRFKARVHLEAREVDGYVLTIAKSGIKFKETSRDATAGGGAPAAVPDATSPIARGAGGRGGGRGDGGGCSYVTTRQIFVRGKCGMGEVTRFLRQLWLSAKGGPPPIADKTGLMGIYDIDFALEEVLSAPTRGPGVRGGGSQLERQFTPPVPKALEEQLGLHLERGKAPAEFVVIDHIEQPTEN